MDHTISPSPTHLLPTDCLISVPRSDRWQIHQRLQELGIACACLQDGSFKVEVNSPVAVLQIRSVLNQTTASRQHLLEWLESCWKVS